MNQKGFIKDTVIIILAILLLGGGYFYFSKKPAYAPADNANISQKVSDETADWKTYRNEKYGFEFKYPKYFEIISDNINSGSFKSKTTDSLSFKVYDRSLDDFEYVVQSDSFMRFKYNRELNQWIATKKGVENKFAPVEYRKGIYLVRTGDGAGEFEISYIKSPAGSFMIEMTASRNGSWTECINPCPEIKPFSDDKIINNILDSIKFIN